MSFELPFKLPTGWQVATVDELVKQKIIAKPLDGNHGGIHPKASDYIESGVPFVMASDLAGGRVDLIDCKFISEEQASGLRKGIAKAGDVLLSHKATIGRTAIVQDSKHDFIMLTPQVTYYRVINSSALSNIYLKAYFDSRFFQSIIGLWAGAGSTRAYLGITGQLKLPIILPPIEIQNEISGQVHALNKKVNLNNEINQTLEQMAQAIFKSWFVDFDPVKAKMNGEQPQGMDAATASLFPDKLVESELGLIPEGWAVNQLSDICKNHSQSYDLKSVDEVIFVNTGDVLEGDFLHKDYSPVAGLPGQAKKAIKEDDILYSEIRPKNKRFAYVDFDVSDYVVSTKFMVIQANEKVHPRLLYMILTRQNTIDEFNVIADSRSGTFPQITFKAISNLNFCIAPREVQDAFVTQVMPMIKLQRSLKTENKQLADLRDTLLPKLLSGEIELGQTEEMAEVS